MDIDTNHQSERLSQLTRRLVQISRSADNNLSQRKIALNAQLDSLEFQVDSLLKANDDPVVASLLREFDELLPLYDQVLRNSSSALINGQEKLNQITTEATQQAELIEMETTSLDNEFQKMVDDAIPAANTEQQERANLMSSLVQDAAAKAAEAADALDNTAGYAIAQQEQVRTQFMDQLQQQQDMTRQRIQSLREKHMSSVAEIQTALATLRKTVQDALAKEREERVRAQDAIVRVLEDTCESIARL